MVFIISEADAVAAKTATIWIQCFIEITKIPHRVKFHYGHCLWLLYLYGISMFLLGSETK